MLFSAGTFVFVAAAHVLPELVHNFNVNGNRFIFRNNQIVDMTHVLKFRVNSRRTVLRPA